MPRYRVTEERCYKAGYIIDAEDEDAAKQLDGEIVSEGETDSWGERLLECEEVDPEEEDLDL